jgi:hypothetical protein
MVFETVRKGVPYINCCSPDKCNCCCLLISTGIQLFLKIIDFDYAKRTLKIPMF